MKGYRYCGKSSLSFTEAKVYGRDYGCLSRAGCSSLRCTRKGKRVRAYWGG